MASAIEKAKATAAAAREAQEAMGSSVPESAQIVTLPTAGLPAVSTGKKLSMDNMGAGLDVDVWLKVNEDGLKIGDGKLFDSLTVSLELTDGVGFAVKRAIKFGKNPVTYYYTYDGIAAAHGGSWDAAVQKAMAMDNLARDYPCVELPFRLEEAVKDTKQNTTHHVGTKLGYTTSTTAWTNWKKLYAKCSQEDLLGKRVLIKLTAEPKTKNGNTWGVLAYELIGEFEEGDE